MYALLCSALLSPLPPVHEDLLQPCHAVEGHLLDPVADVGEVVVGELTGDGLMDAVVRCGGLWWVFGPAVHHGIFLLPWDGVTSFDVLAGGAAGGHDALVVSRAEGLELWQVDASAWNRTTLVGAAAANARSVRVADVDGSGSLDVVGLDAGGTNLWCLRDALGAATWASVPLTEEGFDLVPLDWSGDGEPELALTTAADVRVVHLDGSVSASLGVGHPDWPLTITRDPGATHERIVGSALLGPNDHLYGWDAQALDGPTWMGPHGFVSLASGDLDQDGDDDLVAVRTASRNPKVYRNLAPVVPNYKEHGTLLNEVLQVGEEVEAAGSRAGVALADFDLDGDLDVICGDPLSKAVVLCRGTATEHGENNPRLMGSAYRYHVAQDKGTVTLKIDASAYVGQATHFRAIVWSQPDGLSPLSMTSEGTVVGTLAASGWTDVSFELPTSLFSNRVYWFDVRCYDAATETQSSPLVVAFYTSGTAADQLEQSGGFSGPALETPIFDATNGASLSWDQLGSDVQSGVREAGDMPCYEEDDPGNMGMGTVPGTPGGGN